MITLIKFLDVLARLKNWDETVRICEKLEHIETTANLYNAKIRDENPPTSIRTIKEKKPKLDYINHFSLIPFTLLSNDEILDLVSFYRNLSVFTLILSPIIIALIFVIVGLLLKYTYD